MSELEMDSETATMMEGHGGLLATEVLLNHGVEVVFTLSGGHIFPLYDGCVKRDVRLVDVRHEQTAVFAAEAYAKVTRRLGVAAVTAGPGVTNAVSALTTAHFNGSPIAVLGGRAPEARWGQGSLQELDHVPIVKPVSKEAVTIRQTVDIPAELDRLFTSAQSPHRGPVFADVPFDTFFGSTRAVIPPAGAPGAAADLDEAEVSGIAGLIGAAERPVLMVGSDVYWEGAEEALCGLAESAGLPVLMNGMGRGVVGVDHELAFSRARGLALKETDLVVVTGVPLDFRLGFGRFAKARVVHIMDRPERVATNAPLAASASGRIASILRALAGRIARRAPQPWLDKLQEREAAVRNTQEEAFGSDTNPIQPPRIYGALCERLDRDSIVIGDGGDFVSYAGKLVDVHQPGRFLEPGPYGCLGTGAGYALGAHFASPESRLFLMLGDGAAGFSMGDLDTLVRFEVPVTIIVGNNSCWGLEKHPMKQFFGYHVAAELGEETRYDQVMQALGGYGELVSEARELGPALDRAMESRGPALVNVITDPEDAYPRSSNLA
ncbi:MAG: acetolactate synthase [Acidobacteriota bacterium]|nr:acetolactate synthase [Acidobacteriota bacterium]